MAARHQIKPFSFLDTEDLCDEVIRLALTDRIPADPAHGRLPTYLFSIRLRAGDRPVGRCDLRIGFNESIYYSGNIGYRVFAPYRGHHYAARACLLLLRLAQKHRMPQVVITCRPDNKASRKTCERIGARLMSIVPLPPSHDLYREGAREECRYLLFFDEFR